MSARHGALHQQKSLNLTHSLTHSLICNTLPLYLYTQEQGWTLELDRQGIGEGFGEGDEEEEEKYQHPLMDLLNTFHFNHGELKRISLISWNFLQKPNSWFWMLDLESLADGGSIIWIVSQRNQHLPQSPSYPLDFLWFLSFGYLQEKGGEYVMNGMLEMDEAYRRS